MAKRKKNVHAVALGRKGGKVLSAAKTLASRANGKKGGRPKLAIVLLALALGASLAGCVAGPGLLPGSTDNVQAMRADLRACTLGDGAWAFALIPDFGTTGDHQRVKCMLQRGWLAGPDRTGGGVRDYMRIEPVPVVLAPAPIAPTEPTWATGE